MRALIAGATGFVGRRLGPALLEDGLEVRCMVRDAARAVARELPAPDATCWRRISTAGVDEAAFAGVDVAYFLVHMMGRVPGYAHREREVANAFGAAALDAGAGQMVYLGGLGEEPTRPICAVATKLPRPCGQPALR